jgi:hypothetical protein
MSTPVSNEVLQVQYEHISEQLAKVLEVLQRTPTRDEVRDGNTALDRRIIALEAKDEAKNTRIRALEDARTSTEGMVSLVKWFMAIGGGSVAIVAIRYLVLGSA